MPREMRRLIALTGLLIAGIAAEPTKENPPSVEQIRQAVKDLGSERFAVRQRAMKLLWNAGDAAEKPLREAANSADPEVARQAQILLERIAYRIDPDAPPELVTLMQRFRSAQGVPNEQSKVIREMLQLGSKGHIYLLRLLEAVDANARRLVLDEFAYDDWKVLSTLMAEGQEELVAELLDKAIGTLNESAAPHYAAFQALTDRLDAKIASYRDRMERGGSTFDARVLLALCRLKGDAAGSLWAGRKLQSEFWIRQVLMEQGQWAELLQEQRKREGAGLSQVTDLGYLAAYQRLAGREAELPATWKQIQDYVGEISTQKNNRPWYAAKVLLINEQPALAMQILQRHDQHALVAEILAAQGKYREALVDSERGAQAESGAKYADRAFHIDLLLRAGERAKAGEWLKKLRHDMGESGDASWQDRLAVFQARLGEREAAEKHLLQRLEKRDGSTSAALFAALFPRLEVQAQTLWEILEKKYPDERPEQLFRRLRRFDDGSATPTETAEALKFTVPVNRHNNQPNFEAVARLVALLQQPDVAKDLLGHAAWEKAPASAKLWLADALADAGRWPDAAGAYRKVWELDKSAPLPLFLHAHALLKVNPNDAQAKPLIERSHRMPLGGDSARYYFHTALRERGFLADSERELALCTRLLTNSNWVLGMAHDHLARGPLAQSDSLAAAAVLERNILRFMPTSTGFRGSASYGRATADIHVLRAKGLLAAGKKSEAFAEIERAERLQPAHLDVAIRLVPALEKAGEQKRANELFDRVAAAWRTACSDFPECADAHNQLAWLNARCRRQLDDGLTHARRAVELAPQNPSYSDTLAENLFQRGDRAAAIELIRKCLKMPGANTGFYRQQLARFERGDPKEEPAEE